MIHVFKSMQNDTSLHCVMQCIVIKACTRRNSGIKDRHINGILSEKKIRLFYFTLLLCLFCTIIVFSRMHTCKLKHKHPQRNSCANPHAWKHVHASTHLSTHTHTHTQTHTQRYTHTHYITTIRIITTTQRILQQYYNRPVKRYPFQCYIQCRLILPQLQTHAKISIHQYHELTTLVQLQFQI